MGKASKRKKQRKFFSSDLLSTWSRDSCVCFIRDLSLKADIIITPPQSMIVSNRLKILQFLETTIITPETKKLWEARQSEYLKGIVSIHPQKLLANLGMPTSPTQSLFEWNFWGEDELGQLARSTFGSTKTSITAFMANQLKEYLPEKEFLVLACGLPTEFNSVEDLLVKLGDLEELRMNIFLKVDKNI